MVMIPEGGERDEIRMGGMGEKEERKGREG